MSTIPKQAALTLVLAGWVSVAAGQTPTLIVDTTPINVSGVVGSIVNINIAVSSNSSQISFTASSSEFWLEVPFFTMATPFSLGAIADLTGLSPGVHTAILTISPQTPTTNGPQQIQVNVTVLSAAAAPAKCTVMPPASTFLRAEGYTELIPDVVVQCTVAPNLATTVGIQMFSNTDITSRLIGPASSEALLLVNEPPVASRQIGTNAFLGQAALNSLTWTAIPVAAPASGQLTLRVSNLRVNTNMLGVSSTFSQEALFLFVDLSIGGVQVLQNVQQTFADSIVGSPPLSGGVSGGPGIAFDQRQCDDSGPALFTYSPSSALNPALPEGGTGQVNFNVRFREQIPKGFSTAQEETGNTVPGSPLVGVATQGTRLAVQFSNLTPGVQVFVTTGAAGPNDSASAQAVLVSTDSSGAGAFSPIAATAKGVCTQNGSMASLAAVAISGGGGMAVWEITTADLASFEQLSFGVALSGPFTGFEIPTISASLAPFGVTSANSFASSSLSVPRFNPALAASRNIPIAEGLTFVGVAGGGAIPHQSISIACQGCSAPVVSTTSGGTWLAAAVSASSAAAETLDISVSQAGLSAGTYFGQVSIGSGGSLTIVFEVVAANVDPGPIVTPIGLVFVAPQGSGQTATQNVTIHNLTTSSLTYTSTNPTGSGTVGAKPVTVPISFNLTGKSPGSFSGITHFAFSDGFQTDVVSAVVVTPAAGGGVDRPAIIAPSGCTPTDLVVDIVSLGPQNNLAVGYGVSITAQVTDSPCGNPVTAASVSATFSSEPTRLPIPNDPVTPGLYDALWTPQSAAPGAQITVTASASGVKSASQTVSRNVVLPSATSQAPVISAGGVINVYSGLPVLAPGEAISIYGQNLADQPYSPEGPLPLPPMLGPTQVFLLGRSLPLFYASPNVINALVPLDVPPGTYPMKVTVGAAISSAVSVTLSGAGPGLYPNAFRLDGLPANAANPVHVGDEVLLYAVGLGPVAYAPGAGAAAPESPLASLVGGGLTVTIGGVPVPVIDYAGLTPDTAGLYQINVKVPVGVSPGTAQVVVTAAGVAAPAITLSVQ